MREPEELFQSFRKWILGNEAPDYRASDCMFARRLLVKQKERTSSWHFMAVDDLDPLAFQPGIVDVLIPSLLNGGAELIQIAFPRLDSPELIARLLSKFGSHHRRWTLTEEEDKVLQCIHVGLTYRCAVTSLSTTVMGTANLTSMPDTRAAPFTSILIRIGGQSTNYEKYGKIKNRNPSLVSLADIDAGELDVSVGESWWTEVKTTSKAKRKKHAGIAGKYSFSLPISAKQYLNFK